jgi:predicted dehydrogenase
MTLRVGFLGAGNIATYHSKSLRASGEDVERSLVFDPDLDRSEAFAMASGADVATSADHVIEHSDAVYVCTWTSEHEALVARAAEAGVAVFCEKPLGTTLTSAARMVEVVERSGVTNQVGLILRRSPVFHLLKQLGEDDASGDLITVVFRDDQFLPIRGMYASTWRADVEKAGAGVLLEHSIHDVDLLEWMYGPITSVSASTRFLHGIPGIEDSAVAHYQFANGVHATLTSVWHDLLERQSNRQVEVFGSTLWAQLTGEWFGEVRWSHEGVGGGKVEQRSGAAVTEAVRDPLAGENPDGAFIRAVRDGRSAYPTMADALRAHIVVDATYRSAAAGGALITI